MSKTEEIDKTIAYWNKELEQNPKMARKDRLAITDRLIKLFGMKLKHADDGKGGKFNLPSPSNGVQPNAGNPDTRQ